LTTSFTNLIAATALAGAGVAAAQPAPQLQKVTLVATDYSFAPSTIHVVQGRPVEITVVNRSTHVHGLRLDLSFGEVPFPTNVPPGATQSVTVDDVGSPGSYRFYCPVEDHDSRGMHGAIVVDRAK
jgi:plastocyanin